jgi:UDP-N-acetylglucosamine acyltransferase
MTTGNNTYIHSTALIADFVHIEDDCYIGPYCVIGFPAEYKGKEHLSCGVFIGKGTRVTGMVTIDSGVGSTTVISEGCYLMKHSHVGHDAILRKGVTLSCGAKVGGHAIIGEGTNIGLNAVIHQHKEVPEGCMIGMGAVITKGLEMFPGQKYVGNPAKWLSVNEKK